MRLEFSASATAELFRLRANADLRHPGLKTHKYTEKKCPHGKDLFEAYAQNRTPGAYRIFFCYPPGQGDTLFIVDITDHP